MLQQPRVPTTGQRQAIEIQIKWREVLAQKQAFLKILSKHTGHSMQKLDAVSPSNLDPPPPSHIWHAEFERSPHCLPAR